MGNKTKMSFWSQVCPSKPVGEGESKGRRKRRKKEEEKKKIKVCVCLRIKCILDS